MVQKYYPPNGWNCRCTVVQVRKNKYPTSDPTMAMLRGDNCTDREKQKMFRYNPGKTMELFPPKHPYYKTSTKVKSAIEGNLTEMYNSGIGGHVPPTLNTREQKAWIDNEHALADILIEQGMPMTHKEANEHHANPNFQKGIRDGYSQNCQSCVVAYELRRRGYDVEALMRIRGDSNNIPEKLAYHTELAWRIPETNDIPQKNIAKATSLTELNLELNKLVKECGRYHINWVWKNRDMGHIVVCEKFANGGLRFYDPQVGEILKWSDVVPYIKEEDGIGVLRVDKLLINMDLVKGIVKPK